MPWLNILLFLVGFALLVKGGDWFVDGATGIARRFKMSEVLIGATVVSIGTTLPEVMVSAGAAIGGHGEMAYGNAIGSIICNTALIAAITVACKPCAVDRKPLLLPLGFFYGASVLYMISAYCFRGFSRWIGIIFLSLFVLYIILSIPKGKAAKEAPSAEKAQPEGETVIVPFYKDIIPLVVGAVLIAIGADLLVEHGTVIAQLMGVPEAVIALTFIALGTSLPELVTAITSLVKGHGALSLGNIIGANLFNLVLVSGTSATLRPFTIPSEQTLLGLPSSLVIDLPLTVVVMSLLTLPALIRGKLSRVQGILLLLIYAAFCSVQFIL